MSNYASIPPAEGAGYQVGQKVVVTQGKYRGALARINAKRGRSPRGVVYDLIVLESEQDPALNGSLILIGYPVDAFKTGREIPKFNSIEEAEKWLAQQED